MLNRNNLFKNTTALNKRGLLILSILAVLTFNEASAKGEKESNFIRNLPCDAVRLSTSWMVIPNEIYEVGKKDGPISAIIKGPFRGSTILTRAFFGKLFDLINPNVVDDVNLEIAIQQGGSIRYYF